MASLDNDLTLHLALDEIQNGLAPDESANDNDGAVKGDPQLVPDELFGSCFDFDGTDDYVEIKDPFKGGKDFTVAVWLKPAALDDGQTHGALGFDAKPSLSLAPSGGALQFDYSDAAQKQYTDRLANFFTKAGEWVHAAWVKEGTQFRFYRGGQLFDTREAATDFAADEKTGYCVGRADGFWKGQLAHARVYSRALTAEEIQQVMLDDQTAAAAFRQSHPIDFYAYDDDQQPVIVIDNGGPGKNLHFEIANGSQRSIELVTPASPTPSSGNYHFALRFRPGALSSSSLSRVGPAAAELGWGFFQEQRADGSVSLYFLQPTPPAGSAAAPGKSIVLTLPDVSAEAAGGSRGTRVELSYSQLRYVGASEQLSGSRAQHLEIISERGKRNVPLHVGFLGSNRVLNDGQTPNELKLRVTNTLAEDPIALTPNTSADAPTTFTLSFDVQPDGAQREWALGTSDDVQAAHVSVVRRAEDNPHGSLALHLPLATVEGGKTPAAAGQAGAVQGSPSPLPEDMLGGCLRFDGAKDFVETADPFANKDNFTIAIWARPDALDDGSFHGMVGYQDSAGRKPGLWQAPSGGGLHYDSYDASKTRYNDILAGFFTKAGEWVHVAWVKEGTLYRFYRDGKLYATRAAPQQFAADAKTKYWVGRVDNFWKGRLAHARVYSRALTDEEVQEVMLADRGLDALDADWQAKVVGLEGETPVWELTTAKTALDPGEMFQVRLRDFVSSLPSGQTDLYVRYKNLPGYWDGQFVVAAEKSPLVTDGQRVGVGVNNPRSALDTGLGLLTGAAADYQRAQAMLMGGGKVTWTPDATGGRLKWSDRFIAISMGGMGQSFKQGYVNIYQPASDIPAAYVWDGKNRSVNQSGVLLSDWEALYAVHRVGGGSAEVEFRVVLYTSPFAAPSNWLLVAVRNADDLTVRLGNGVTLSPGSSSTNGSPIPSGTIMMWSGKADSIPGGWVLCDGNNGTPKLQDRFVVAATAANALNSGDADQHAHSYDIPPSTFTTSSDGGHTHGFPGWYKRNMSSYAAVSKNDYSLIDSNGNDPKNQTTNGAGAHSHRVTVDYGPLNTAAAAAGRPAWFALCYIMKL